jgi:hypothetical protein
LLNNANALAKALYFKGLNILTINQNFSKLCVVETEQKISDC